VLAAGQVQELLVERSASRGHGRQHLRGQGGARAAGMQSAFVESAWSARRSCTSPTCGSTGTPCEAGPARRRTGKPIEKILAEGQPLMVQVLKDPIGSKGARLSTQLSVAGRLLVYLPQDPHIGVSQRIEDEAGRAALRDRLKELLPPARRAASSCARSPKARRRRDARRHRVPAQPWRDIHDASLGAQPPQAVYQDLSLAERVLRDMVSRGTAAVRIDSRENHQKLAAFAAAYMPALARSSSTTPASGRCSSLQRRAGDRERRSRGASTSSPAGTLVIDQTEAMTTIDVKHRRLWSASATSTTPCSRPTSRRRSRSRASSGCATSAA
jgi:ribonuclease G